DRAKAGCKRHLLTDACGVPLVVWVGPANRRDEQAVPALLWLLGAVLACVGGGRPGGGGGGGRGGGVSGGGALGCGGGGRGRARHAARQRAGAHTPCHRADAWLVRAVPPPGAVLRAGAGLLPGAAAVGGSAKVGSRAKSSSPSPRPPWALNPVLNGTTKDRKRAPPSEKVDSPSHLLLINLVGTLCQA